MELYACRGTKKSLLRAVNLYIREPAYLVEQHKLAAMYKGNKGKLIRRLYGSNPYLTTLLVREEKVPSDKEFRTLHEIVRDNIPAQMLCQIVVLKPYIFLDQHTYLGINSVLGKYRSFELGREVRLPFGVLERKRER